MLRCVDGEHVCVRRDILTSVSPVWTAVVCEEGVREYKTGFSAASLGAFVHAAQLGRAGHETGNASFQWLHDMLGPMHAYNASGIRSYMIHALKQHSLFISIEEEMCVQKIIINLDGHGFSLPDCVVARLANTIIGSHAHETEYLWKISTEDELSGFPVHRLSTRLLRRISKSSPCGKRNLNVVDTLLKKRACIQLQTAYRSHVAATHLRSRTLARPSCPV